MAAGDLLSLFLPPTDSRSGKRGEGSIPYESTAITAAAESTAITAAAIPQELQGLRIGRGHHNDGSGTQHLVVKEPKSYSFPRDKNLNRRSTWTMKKSQWAQIEEGEHWSSCPNKKLKISEQAEKAAFLFGNRQTMKLKQKLVPCWHGPKENELTPVG